MCIAEAHADCAMTTLEAFSSHVDAQLLINCVKSAVSLYTCTCIGCRTRSVVLHNPPHRQRVHRCSS